MSGGKHLLGRPKRHIFGTAKVGEKGQIDRKSTRLNSSHR